MNRRNLICTLCLSCLFFVRCSSGQNTQEAAEASVTKSNIVYTQNIEEDQKHPVDQAFDECIAPEASNLAMRKCLAEALEGWDAALNTAYKKLRTQLFTQAQKDDLKAAQLEWIKFRDLEFAFIESQFEELDSSMYPTLILKYKVEIVKQRAIELETYVKFREIQFD